MKKVVFIFTMLLCLVMTSNTMVAQGYTPFSTFSSEDLAGTYYGDLTKVYMNSDKDPVSGVSSSVVVNSTGTINISMDEFSVGNMPGTIAISANNISVNEDGSFSQTCSRCVTLKILGIPTRYDALVEGTIKNDQLVYTITVNSEYSGAAFTAIVTFEGSK